MKKFLISVVALAVLGFVTTPIYANDAHHQAEAQKSYAVKGEVVAIDMAASKVKLKHQAVPELNWPAMTMFFPVADKSQLDAVKVGDQVSFVIAKDKVTGQYVIQSLEVVK